MNQHREQERQQWLLRHLLAREGEAAQQPLLAGDSTRRARGWQAYEANAGASAERALQASFPTVRLLMGDDSFAALARAFWQSQPPQRGDLAWFGEGLPGFIAASEQLADVPYLADCAQLDWAVAQAERAADDAPELHTLSMLGEHDPAALHIDLPPGMAVLPSAYPIVSLWEAHHRPPDGTDAFADVRVALRDGRGENALVVRQGWRGGVGRLDAPTVRWLRGLLRGLSVSQALAEAGEGFDFEHWLLGVVRDGGWLRVRAVV